MLMEKLRKANVGDIILRSILRKALEGNAGVARSGIKDRLLKSERKHWSNFLLH